LKLADHELVESIALYNQLLLHLRQSAVTELCSLPIEVAELSRSGGLWQSMKGDWGCSLQLEAALWGLLASGNSWIPERTKVHHQLY